MDSQEGVQGLQERAVTFTPGMRVVVKDGIEADDMDFGAGFYGVITDPYRTDHGPAWRVEIRGNAYGRPLPGRVPAYFYDHELEVVD